MQYWDEWKNYVHFKKLFIRLKNNIKIMVFFFIIHV